MTERERGIGGRKAIPITYTDVEYDGKEYTIGKITKLDGTVSEFVVDRDDKEKVMARKWHCGTGGQYISSVFRTASEGTKALYLHNLIMGKLTFYGKGATESVDHINGLGTDNRKANLRVVSQSLQNRNTKQRERKTDKLPSDIDPDEIPRNIWYIPDDGHHGDRFAVEIKGIPGVGDILWRTTSSKSVSSREKLGMAIQKRNELFASTPVLREYARESELSRKLLREYEDICSLCKHL